MIERTSYIDKLNAWLNRNDSTALMVLGPLEVGKTTLIKEWAKNIRTSSTFFEKEEYARIKDIFVDSKNKNFDVHLAIVNKLFRTNALSQLIIFDGVSPKDEIIVQLKNLCANSKHRFILISDFNEYLFNRSRFIPVGQMTKLIVRPLSFKEYCLIRTNKSAFEPIKFAFSQNEYFKLPFANMFDEIWDEYSNYGGFPSVVDKLLKKGNISAENELKRIKNRIISFVEDNIPFSLGPMAILNKYGIGRSTAYRRFIFTNVSENGTLQRYKRSINILERLGIIGVLPFIGDNLVFEYCDIFLCDPGLERIWDMNYERKHIAESIVFNYGIRKGVKPYRYVLSDRRTIDLAWDHKIPTVIEIKLKNTNLLETAVSKLNYYRMNNGDITYKPAILVDKGVDYVCTENNARVCPIWAYLLKD